MEDPDKSESGKYKSKDTSQNDPSSEIALCERNIETYHHAVEDARRTHDNQLEAYNDVSEKAWRIVRLNGIVATILIAALTSSDSLQNSTTSVKPFYILGGFGLILSTLFAIFGQRAKWVKLGPEPKFYEEVRNLNPPEQEYLLEVLKGYENYLLKLKSKTAENGRNVSVAMYLLLLSVTFILAGTFIVIL